MGRSNGGSPHSSLTSDTTFNLFDPAMVPHYFLSCTAPTDPTCYGRIHAEIDHDWKAAGYCGTGTACDNTTLASQTVTATTKIDIQGFVYWDNGNLNSSWHQYNGWEIHPVTGWRISNPNPPDYTLTTSPSNVKLNAGITGNSILTVNSTNGFTGTVDLTAAANSTSLTCTLASTSINNGSGTSAISCNSSVAGNYLATVTGTSGTLTHTAIVVFQVQDFKINANPSSLTISSVSGTPGTSSIDLSSLNGFAGTVTLTASIAPNGLVGLFPPRTSLSPTAIALTSDGTGESILTVSPSLLTTPGTYTVSITAKNGSLSHSTEVTVTVGLV